MIAGLMTGVVDLMTSHTARPVRSLPGWAVGCLVAGAAAVVWWASSMGLYKGPDHLVGPYTISVALEYTLGGVALALAIAVLATRPTPRASKGLSPAAVGLLVITGAVATGLWRVMSAGVNGANIGGAFAALLGPFVVADCLWRQSPRNIVHGTDRSTDSGCG